MMLSADPFCTNFLIFLAERKYLAKIKGRSVFDKRRFVFRSVE